MNKYFILSLDMRKNDCVIDVGRTLKSRAVVWALGSNPRSNHMTLGIIVVNFSVHHFSHVYNGDDTAYSIGV